MAALVPRDTTGIDHDPATAIATLESGGADDDNMGEEMTGITTAETESATKGSDLAATGTTGSMEPVVSLPQHAAESISTTEPLNAVHGHAQHGEPTAAHSAVSADHATSAESSAAEHHVQDAQPAGAAHSVTTTSDHTASAQPSAAEHHVQTGESAAAYPFTASDHAPSIESSAVPDHGQSGEPTVTAPVTNSEHAEPAESSAAGNPAEAGEPSSSSSARLRPEDDSSSFGTPSSFSVGLSVDTDNDTDSAFGGSVIPNSSMSATSSVYEFVEEFGRTFHRYKEGKYFLPNDEQEIGRLDLQHRIALQILDWKLYLAPIERPNRVLDLGTGTGIWAIEFADQNPESDVLGTDLSPIQPEYVPANCRFEIDDAEDEWLYSNKFDYIHGRYMCAFLSDFPKLFRNIYDNLNPGGWVEFMETMIYFQSQDGSLDDTALQRWNRLLLEGIRNMGRNALSCTRYKRWMLETGFTNVEEHKFVVPANPWAKGRKNKELGALQMVNNLNGVYGLTVTVFTKGLGWTKDEVEVFLADVRRDMGDKNIHSYITIMVTYGQRPY